MLVLVVSSLLISTVSTQSGFPGFPAFQAPAAPSFPAPSFSLPAPDPTFQAHQQYYAPYWRPVPPPAVWNPTAEEFQRSWNTAVADPRSVWNGEAIRAGTPTAEVQRQREAEQRADDRNTFHGFFRSFNTFQPPQFTPPPAQFGQLPGFPSPQAASFPSPPQFPAPSGFPGFSSGR
ncbi:hypothetical protein QR680_013411 [Steinernema hermaphroditum]|uniref:Pepsin inhibitor-3-like repeated domain-containing protein n=1 Tax=Steinernema hermaphroditum TaxID=289476 RepID=A0AA39I820_9BILA|nr:hypothetical protein QR680_013411 [Steinernema hermaphroditum]